MSTVSSTERPAQPRIGTAAWGRIRGGRLAPGERLRFVLGTVAVQFLRLLRAAVPDEGEFRRRRARVDLERIELPDTRAVAQACREAERYESAWALLSRKNLPPDLLHRMGIEIAAYHGRPALRWQVRTVDGQAVYRWRILRLPKARFAWSLDAAGEVPVGAVDALYGTRGLTGVPLLVNGESSVWACQAHGIRAVTMTLGEGAVSDRAVACIVAHAPVVDIAYDLDDVGRQGAERVAAAVVAAGGAARIIGLPEDLGKGGDVCDLLAQGRAKELTWRRQ
jgi:hypothetical protein